MGKRLFDARRTAEGLGKREEWMGVARAVELMRLPMVGAIALAAGGAARGADVPASSADRVVTGAAALDGAGTSVAFIGDADGDGFGDYIVGFPGDHSAGTNAGRAVVYSGQTGGVLYEKFGAARDHFGFSVGAAGDVDHDGRPDFIVGAPQDEPPFFGKGKAIVYSGRTGGVLRTFLGENLIDGFGVAVAGVGDVNNDEFGDLLIGSYEWHVTGGLVGRAYLFSGQTGGVIRTFEGEAVGDEFGYAVAAAGDVNHDGVPDLVVGAFLNNNNEETGVNTGRTYVYSGADGSLLHFFDGLNLGDEGGFAVAGAGDVDNDGYADIITGARTFDATLDGRQGAAYVYSGQTGALLHAFIGETPNDLFGSSVAAAGDVNGDGFADVLVGSPAPVTADGTGPGRVYLYSGRTGALIRRFIGAANGDEFGTSVAAGPINTAAPFDLIVGAKNKASGAGAAYVFFLHPVCSSDINGDGVVNSSDLGLLLGGWGPCP